MMPSWEEDAVFSITYLGKLTSYFRDFDIQDEINREDDILLQDVVISNFYDVIILQ